MTNYHVPVQTSVPIVATPVANEIQQVTITEDMKTAYSLSRTTKFLCLIDFCFSFLFAVSNPYFFIPVVISILGWWGAKNYSMCQVFLYLIYTLMTNIARVAFTAVYYSNPINRQGITDFVIGLDILITIIGFLLGMWICKIIYKFYASIKDLTNDEIYTLKNLRKTIIVRRIYF
jgi:hypothetical protein